MNKLALSDVHRFGTNMSSKRMNLMHIQQNVERLKLQRAKELDENINKVINIDELMQTIIEA